MKIFQRNPKNEQNNPKNEQVKMMNKTKVFNVIILDRSGSMECIRQAAIDGFNETLAGIQKAQEMYAETQEHFVSLVTFCSCSTEHVFDKVPVCKTKPLKKKDYNPCCCTPLYDAMGITLTAMRRYVQSLEDAVVVVTIITDGMENASCEFTGATIRKLVEELRGEGWTFTYMGANQDSIEVAMTLSIRNARNFDYSEQGTRASMRKETSTRMNFFTRLSEAKMAECEECAPEMSIAERRNFYTSMADAAFDEEEAKN
ncbi:MAG: hypothetical protein ACI3YC_02485 [Alloprevotella sp.]